MTCGFGRYLIVTRFDGFIQIFFVLVLMQSPLILFAMLAFLSNIQKFIIFSYKQVEEKFCNKSLKLSERLRNLDEVDKILTKFEEIFGAQLTIIAIVYTLSTMFYVRRTFILILNHEFFVLSSTYLSALQFKIMNLPINVHHFYQFCHLLSISIYVLEIWQKKFTSYA